MNSIKFMNSTIDNTIVSMQKKTAPDVHQAWNEFEKLLDNSDGASQHTNGKFAGLINKWSIAASIAILLSLGAIIGQMGTTINTQDNYQQIALKDGSQIILNSNSSISFNNFFDLFNRKITLEGEATFDVAKNGKTFRVTTNESIVTVTGTSFNVKSAGNITELGVIEGSVRFESIDGKDSEQNLTAGMFAICKTNDSPTKPVMRDIRTIGNWKNKRLTYHNSPLNAVIKDLEKTYNLTINFDSKDSANAKITGVFEGSSAEDFIKVLCSTIDKEYRKTNGIYTIY